MELWEHLEVAQLFTAKGEPAGPVTLRTLGDPKRGDQRETSASDLDHALASAFSIEGWQLVSPIPSSAVCPESSEGPTLYKQGYILKRLLLPSQSPPQWAVLLLDFLTDRLGEAVSLAVTDAQRGQRQE